MQIIIKSLLANMLSPVHRLSVMLVRPSQVLEVFGIFLRHLVPWPSIDVREKFYGDRPRGTPPPGELHKKGSQI